MLGLRHVLAQMPEEKKSIASLQIDPNDANTTGALQSPF
jgi:hypothetical protein